MPKRAAMLLDRIMSALQKAVDDDNSVSIPVFASIQIIDMHQRRKGQYRIYSYIHKLPLGKRYFTSF